MIAHPRVLSIVTTRRCTAACDHCCVGASPHATASIPISRIRGLIDEAARIPSVERVVFTGGECFTLGHNLDMLIAHAASLGLQTRAISNAYWAVNVRAAHARMASVRKAGLNELMISTGTFHQRFVPVERVILAARESVGAGIATRISIEECDQQIFDDQLLEEGLADLTASGHIALSRDPWITDAGGRGSAVLTHNRSLRSEPNIALGSCPYVLNSVTVTPDQDLISCCGFPHEQLPQLRIGSVMNDGLDHVLSSASDSLMMMWLHVSGPHGIADFVAQYLPGFSLPRTASICQACTLLQRDRSAMAVIDEHRAELFNDVAATFLAVQEDNDRFFDQS